MEIKSNYNATTSQYTITVGESFAFDSYAAFRTAYEALPSSATSVDIDFQHAKTIDSSALGMILLMRDKIEHQISKIELKNPQPAVLEIFRLTNLHTIFEIS
jgi:anti-anti-sigma regulatory factor